MSLKNINQDCVLWEGNNLPCINVFKGDTITTTVHELATVVCEQYESIKNLKNLNLFCLDKSCVNCLEDKVIKDYIQMLLDNDCKIKQLITDYQDQLDNTEDLLKGLDLKCLLESYLINNPEANKCELDLDINKVLAEIIPFLCDLLTSYEDLSDRYDIIKAAFDDFIDAYNIYTEPEINSCLTVGDTLILSQHVINRTDAEICSIRDAIGDIASYTNDFCNVCTDDIYSIGPFEYFINCGTQTEAFCELIEIVYNGVTYTNLYNVPGINIKTDSELEFALNRILEENALAGVFYVLNGEIFFSGATVVLSIVYHDCIGVSDETVLMTLLDVVGPANLAQAIDFQKKLICSLKRRIEKIESTCCKIDCDDIKVGFNQTYDDESNVYILDFIKAAGTDIPEGFTDCGSVMTLVDHNGKTIVLDVVIENDTTMEIDVSALDNTQAISVGIKTCLTYLDNTTCRKCFSGVLNPIDKCGFCKICVTGDDASGYATIIYTTGGTGLEQTAKVNVGQCLTFELPKEEPEIINITVSSEDVAVVTDEEHPCFNTTIPSPIVDTCWYFEIPIPRTLDIVLDSTTGFLGSNVGTLIFKLSPKFDFVDIFTKYRDYMNQLADNVVNLSGYTVNIASLTDNTSVNIFGNVPTGLPANVTNATLCSGMDTVNIDDYPGVGGSGQHYVNLIGPDPQSDLTYTQTMSANSFGFVLTVSGQPLTKYAPKPEIGIVNAINGATTWIKGRYLGNDCNCPS